MTETIVFSLIFAWFKGYKIKEIGKLFKHWSIYPIIFTCMLHIYFVYLVINDEYWFLTYSGVIKTASLLFYFIIIWKYSLLDISIFKKLNDKKIDFLIWLTSPVAIGGLFIIIGTKLNKIAMYYNQNKMPVFVSNSWTTGYIKEDMFNKILQYGDSHTFGNQHTKFIPLTDICDLGFMSFSIGDLLIRMFVFLVIYYAIKQCNKVKNNY